MKKLNKDEGFILLSTLIGIFIASILLTKITINVMKKNKFNNSVIFAEKVEKVATKVRKKIMDADTTFISFTLNDLINEGYLKSEDIKTPYGDLELISDNKKGHAATLRVKEYDYNKYNKYVYLNYLRKRRISSFCGGLGKKIMIPTYILLKRIYTVPTKADTNNIILLQKLPVDIYRGEVVPLFIPKTQTIPYWRINTDRSNPRYVEIIRRRYEIPIDTKYSDWVKNYKYLVFIEYEVFWNGKSFGKKIISTGVVEKGEHNNVIYYPPKNVFIKHSPPFSIPEKRKIFFGIVNTGIGSPSYHLRSTSPFGGSLNLRWSYFFTYGVLSLNSATQTYNIQFVGGKSNSFWIRIHKIWCDPTSFYYYNNSSAFDKYNTIDWSTIAGGWWNSGITE